MAIPPFNEQGWLPEGIHDCTLEQVEERFAGFQRSDQRPQLWAKFRAFIGEAKAAGVIKTIVMDGSFVTAEPVPNDIDIIVIVHANHDFSAALPPVHYNILSQRRVRRLFGLDLVVVKQDSKNLEQAVAFFQQVKQKPAAKKGLIRISI